MGDLNAKKGTDNTGYKDIMGAHGLEQMNNKGERFADMCTLNQLVIGGSIFPHKCIHKVTWRSPMLRRTRLTPLHQPEIQEIRGGCASDERC
jgi:hypothetical protein